MCPQAHLLQSKVLHSHCSCPNFSVDLWQTRAVDAQRGRSCFWIRLAWISCWTHTHTHTPTESTFQIQICRSSAPPAVWCPVHLCTEPLSPSESSDNQPNETCQTVSLNHCLCWESCVSAKGEAKQTTVIQVIFYVAFFGLKSFLHFLFK